MVVDEILSIFANEPSEAVDWSGDFGALVILGVRRATNVMCHVKYMRGRVQLYLGTRFEYARLTCHEP